LLHLRRFFQLLLDWFVFLCHSFCNFFLDHHFHLLNNFLNRLRLWGWSRRWSRLDLSSRLVLVLFLLRLCCRLDDCLYNGLDNWLLYWSLDNFFLNEFFLDNFLVFFLFLLRRWLDNWLRCLLYNFLLNLFFHHFLILLEFFEFLDVLFCCHTIGVIGIDTVDMIGIVAVRSPPQQLAVATVPILDASWRCCDEHVEECCQTCRHYHRGCTEDKPRRIHSDCKHHVC